MRVAWVVVVVVVALWSGCIEVNRQEAHTGGASEADASAAPASDAAAPSEDAGPKTDAGPDVVAADDTGALDEPDVVSAADTASALDAAADSVSEPDAVAVADTVGAADTAPAQDAAASICDELLCEELGPCIEVWCDDDLGCQYHDADWGCDDGNGCTVEDFCQFGQCKPGAPALWDKVFPEPTHDVALATAVLPDGSVAAAGFLSAGGNGEDAWFMRLSEAGEVLWKKTHGGAGQDWARAAAAHPAGDLIVAGHGVFDEDPAVRLWVRRVAASNGQILWEYVHPVASSAGGVAVLPSGDVVVGGWHQPDTDGPAAMLALRLADLQEGQLVWDRSSSGAGEVVGRGIAVTAQHHVVVVGAADQGDGFGIDAFARGFQQDGEPLGWVVLEGESGTNESFNGVAPLVGGGVIAVGGSDLLSVGSLDGWFVEINDAGTVGAATHINPSPDMLQPTELLAVCALGDGTFGIAGQFGNMNGNNDPAWYGRVHADGSKVWDVFGPVALQGMTYDFARGCAGTEDNGVVFVGDRTQIGGGSALVDDSFVVKLDAAGLAVCQ